MDTVGRDPNPVSENRFLPSLTSLRILAALMVITCHTREIWKHSRFLNGIGLVGGVVGVSWFFVLSGFVLMWTFDPKLLKRNFILRRLIRIYPLHFLCLVFCLLGYFFFHVSFAGYVGPHGEVGTLPGTIASFFLVHDWLPGHPEIRQAWDGVSWSLSCEFFFYICAPFVFPRLLAVKSLGRLCAVMLCLWAGLLIFGTYAALQKWSAVADFLLCHPLPRFAEFVFGACGALMVRAGWKLNHLGIATILIVVPNLIYCSVVRENSGFWSPGVVIQLFVPGIFLAITSLAMRDIHNVHSVFRNRFLILFGEASYALYMTHAIFLFGFVRVIGHFFPRVSVSRFWGDMATLVFATCALLVAVITYVYIETPIRYYFMRKLMGKSLVQMADKKILSCSKTPSC